jgi:hypothetical protein
VGLEDAFHKTSDLSQGMQRVGIAGIHKTKSIIAR